MRPTVRTALLAALALGTLTTAPAVAQSYGQPYGYDRYAPPPPPPPPVGQVFPRDEGHVGPLTPNSDGTRGYGPYASHPDTTPDDPARFAYDAEKDRRLGDGRRYRDEEAYGSPPPRYAPGGYGGPGYVSSRYEDAYDRPYDDDRRDAPPRSAYRFEDAPPRYDRPRYGGGYSQPQGYAPPPSVYRGW